MRLIGLSGYARVGKNEAAVYLENHFLFESRAFADKLREFLYRLNPIVDFESGVSVVRVKDVIDQYGWTGYKDTIYNNEIREQLQRLGTDCGRNLISNDVWVNLALRGLNSESMVVMTDCRFPNEAQAITDLGGEIWRINRSGVGPINAHPSETALDNWNWDTTINNNGTLEEYCNNIREAHKASKVRFS